MFEQLAKIKRQIEIVGLCLSGKDRWKPIDYAVFYNCEEVTIKRDLHELRLIGIDIHSEKKNGIRIGKSIASKKMKELIVKYLALCNTDAALDKATALLVKKRKEQALYTIVIIQRCIEKQNTVIIDYEKEAGQQEPAREICPLLIFQSEGYWRVLALHEGRMKQYHLNKIFAARSTERTFQRVPQEEIDDLFRYSFRSWIGAEKYTIKIKLSDLWANRIKPTQLMETQIITEEPDGSIIFEATVNSLDEVASWVLSRGKGVTVLEPQELKEKVISIAQEALMNYSEPIME